MRWPAARVRSAGAATAHGSGTWAWGQPFDGIGVFGNGESGTANTAQRNLIENNTVARNDVLRTLPGVDPNYVLTLDSGINLGAGLAGSSYTTIRANVVRANGLNGIDACSIRGNPCFTDYNVIDANTVADNGFSNLSTPDFGGTGFGININSFSLRQADVGHFYPPTHNLVTNNHITGNASTGLFVGSSANDILDNVVLGNGAAHQTPTDVDFILNIYNGRFDCMVRPPRFSGNVIRGNVFGTVPAIPPGIADCLRAAGNTVTIGPLSLPALLAAARQSPSSSSNALPSRRPPTG